jgi:hypothetical protein
MPRARWVRGGLRIQICIRQASFVSLDKKRSKRATYCTHGGAKKVTGYLVSMGPPGRYGQAARGCLTGELG